VPPSQRMHQNALWSCLWTVGICMCRFPLMSTSDAVPKLAHSFMVSSIPLRLVKGIRKSRRQRVKCQFQPFATRSHTTGVALKQSQFHEPILGGFGSKHFVIRKISSFYLVDTRVFGSRQPLSRPTHASSLALKVWAPNRGA